MIRTPSVDRIVAIADALQGLPEPILFVGASVLGLLATESQAPIPRATEDVDIVALVADYSEHAALAERLRARGFSEDSESRVICRWRFRGWMVDIMPPDPEILGFSNELYPSAIAHSSRVTIDGVPIDHIDAPHFIGTKLLAFDGRGHGDFIASHDIEDLLAVLNSRPETVQEFLTAPAECRAIIHTRLGALSRASDFEEALEGHLANDTPGQATIVFERIRAILTSHP